MAQVACNEDTRGEGRAAWMQAATGYPGRLTVYGLTAIAVCHLLFELIGRNSVDQIAHEQGLVERSQVAMAVFTCVAFFYAAAKSSTGRTGLILCACMVGYAAARESDAWFESVFFDDAYKYLVGLPLGVIALVATYLGRKRVLPESLALVPTPALTLFAIAGIYLCSVCQVLDRPDLWSELGAAKDARTTKAAVEEFAELFGYLVLAFSAVEVLVMSRRASGVAVRTLPAPIPGEPSIDRLGREMQQGSKAA
ncbi:hypothetical protein FYK55_05830 [Roseiconus nitratireducens]|uniref:Uncharacterized protein n=1 Tax=Roseiconus nitratireducens TaxID=2605748 RepID=A0A5M6DFR9_9BACT|nr:hypothetical protein [Roseiconus nitratireducens]KAA5545190.1 hypothetical protein FYK55_05830 [Roseiconus nitratireducens]